MSEEEKDTSTSEKIPVVFERIKSQFQDNVLDLSEEFDELSLVAHKDSIYEILEFLKNDAELSYDFLVDVTAVDYSQMEDVLTKYDYARYMVVYHLYSYKTGNRLRVKAPVHEKELSVRTVTPLWKGADWLEREAYDMFGITFENHPESSANFDAGRF